MLPKMKTFMATAQAGGAELIVISDDAEALAMGRVALALPAGVPEWLSPISPSCPANCWRCTCRTAATSTPISRAHCIR